MAYTQDQIDSINRTRTAIQDRQYIGVNGDVFIGAKEGWLRLMPKASEVNIYNNETTVEDLSQEQDNRISEIESSLQQVSLINYTELEYDLEGNVIAKYIYSDSSKATSLYDIFFSYDADGNIVQKTVVRASDSYQYIKSFNYDVDFNLINITTT